MKKEIQTSKNSRNMSSKSVSKVSKKTTQPAMSALTDWVVDVVSSVLEEDDVTSVREAMDENSDMGGNACMPHVQVTI